MADPVRVLIVAVLLVVLVPVFASLGVTSASGQATIDPNQTYTTLDATVQDIPDTVTVDATTERSLGFDGTTVAETNVGGVPEEWTVCAAADLADDADQTGTYTVVALANETVTLSFDAGKWLAYYNDTSTGKTATASVQALSPTDGFTPLCARYNSSTGLSLFRETEFSATNTLDSNTEQRNVSWNWTGRIDEVRVYGDPLNDSEINAYGSDPVEPRDGAPRLTRLMFDADSGTSATAYFAPVSTATVTNPNWTTGIAGPQLQQGSDYELQADPLELRAPAGGYLDGAPVAYVDWSGSSSVLPFDFGSLASLFAALVVALALARQMDLL